MKRTAYVLIPFVFTAAAVILFFTFLQPEETAYADELGLRGAETPADLSRSGEAARTFVTEASIGAVGDVLLHARVYDDAETEDGGYDFLSMLEPIEPYIQELDFVMANQESMPGGTDIGLSTYPLFNSPRQIATDLQTVGFDFLSLANNHSLDAGLEGIYSSIDHLNEIGMDYTGIFESEEDRATDRIIDVNGIDFGIVSYTYGTNGIPIPQGHEYSVSLLDNPELPDEIAALREKSDVVIVHAHWGDEYVLMPNAEQQRMAQVMVDAGADIIIGHHPHVLQPIEWLEDEDGREAIVYYSLGNFLSGQVFEYTDIGGIARLNVQKTVTAGETEIKLSEPNILPTFVHHNDHDDYRVILLEDAYEKGYIDKSAEKMINHTEQLLE
ncbi:CapA family protein [Alteribacter natronophilus]|uniref:CapA family protein n=1 Tax=Alteribacter natronophilus TaxID=2583810 RepID=UPI001485FF6F|nr:CapA family protein [Alteribacter natronophilus]